MEWVEHGKLIRRCVWLETWNWNSWTIKCKLSINHIEQLLLSLSNAEMVIITFLMLLFCCTIRNAMSVTQRIRTENWKSTREADPQHWRLVLLTQEAAAPNSRHNSVQYKTYLRGATRERRNGLMLDGDLNIVVGVKRSQFPIQAARQLTSPLHPNRRPPSATVASRRDG